MKDVWISFKCDKKNCKKESLRVMEEGGTIVTEQCDHCGKLVREPIWVEIELDKAKINEIYEN